MKQLFTQLDLSKIDDEAIQLALHDDLATSDVYLTFRWTPNRRILIYRMLVKNGTQVIDALNDNAVNTKEGSYSIHLGSYLDKAELEISFGLMGLVAVPKLVVLLSQNNPDKAYQASPIPPEMPHNVEAGDPPLEKTIKYTVQ